MDDRLLSYSTKQPHCNILTKQAEQLVLTTFMHSPNQYGAADSIAFRLIVVWSTRYIHWKYKCTSIGSTALHPLEVQVYVHWMYNGTFIGYIAARSMEVLRHPKDVSRRRYLTSAGIIRTTEPRGIGLSGDRVNGKDGKPSLYARPATTQKRQLRTLYY